MKTSIRYAVLAVAVMAMLLLSCSKEASYDLGDGVIQDMKDTITGVHIQYVYDGVLEFVPDEMTKAGIVFYPGAFVDYRAYAPLLASLSQQGFLCVLVEPPMDFALMSPNVALRLKKQYPETDSWYVAGHSLGGATAAMCVASHQDDFEGLVLLAAYSTKDISKTNLKAVSIYGTCDGVLNIEKYEQCRANLPESTVELAIEGGCHSYFAWYGHQQGDGTPTITREQQLRLAADCIVEALSQ